MDGPRLVAEPSTQSAESALISDPEATEQKSAAQEDDPEHNPFAGPSSRAPPSASTSAQESEMPHEEKRGAPASLTLLDRLFSAYELRALAQGAQDLVAPPDELDLNAWVGPDLSDPALLEDSEDDRSTGRGQGGQKPEVDEYGRPKVVRPSAAEEKAQLAVAENGQKAPRKGKKGKRREGAQGEDDQNDVDSIPIIKLDLEDAGDGAASPVATAKAKTKKSQQSSSSGTSVPTIARTRPRSPSPPPLILSAGGEAPVSRSKAASPVPPSPTPVSGARTKSNGKARVTIADAQAEDAAASATAPVKVVKVKKKSRSKGKEADVEALDGGAAGAGADEGSVTAVRKKKKKVKPDQGQDQDVAIQ